MYHLRFYGAGKEIQILRLQSIVRALRRLSANERRLLFAGAVQRTTNERLSHRVMFGTMAGGVNPGRGRPEKNRARCLVGDIRVFEATEGSTTIAPL